MGRPRLALRTAGTIKTYGVKPNFRARCLYRDPDGVNRPIERSGRSKGAAEAALKKAIKERTERNGGADLNGDTTVDALLTRWWAWKLETSDPKLSAGTQASYEDIMSRIIVPGMGQVRLHEVSTGLADDWLISERTQRRAQSELARTILNQAFAFATRRDAISGNPFSSVSKPRKKSPVPRALTVEELAALRDAVRSMRQNLWLADIFEVQLGVAGRIGEILALTVADLDLKNPESPRVRIAATVITPTGQKHSRQPHTKDGADGRRTVIVPAWVAEILKRRALLAGPSGLIFQTRNDTLLSPRNVRSSWRNIREQAGLGWVTPHNLRKTAVTKVNSVFGLEIASAFVEHKTSEVMKKHYVEVIEAAGPDVRSALDELAPRGHLTLVKRVS